MPLETFLFPSERLIFSQDIGFTYAPRMNVGVLSVRHLTNPNIIITNHFLSQSYYNGYRGM